MTYRNIYHTALALLGMTADTPGIGDFENRAPMLSAMLVQRLARYSEQLGGWAPETVDVPSLDESFALDVRLAPTFAYELAAALIFDELPDIAKNLRELAKDDRSRVLDEAARRSPTREVHGL